MANEEQLSILKQGVGVWNKWREENPNVDIELIGADLTQAKLEAADLMGANLTKTKLGAAQLGRAKLIGADLIEADLTRAILRGADLRAAVIRGANLWAADLMGANLSNAMIQTTLFANIDLSEVIGLEKVDHAGPSSISTDTVVLSKGKLPEVFLKGCGLSDADIEYSKLSNPDLSNEEINKILYDIYDLRATQALQISPLFISYSHVDRKFVDKIGNTLTKKGIRYWRDVHDMKAGRIEKQIDRAIELNPTVLLILSKNALKSDWVEHEVRKARTLEKKLKRDVLCPVALDNNWKHSRWPERLMEQITEYNILDFSDWKDDGKFDGMFHKLIDGLELFYKG